MIFSYFAALTKRTEGPFGSFSISSILMIPIFMYSAAFSNGGQQATGQPPTPFTSATAWGYRRYFSKQYNTVSDIVCNRALLRASQQADDPSFSSFLSSYLGNAHMNKRHRIQMIMAGTYTQYTNHTKLLNSTLQRNIFHGNMAKMQENAKDVDIFKMLWYSYPE